MARQERERRYIAEYMKDHWPEGNWALNIPLGPIPEYLTREHGMVKAARYFRPTRPRVDAIHWTPETYTLIEAKVREAKQGIGDLIFYRGLAKETVDLPFYEGQQIQSLLIVPWAIDWIIDSGRQNDIEVDVYWQDWIQDYAEERKHYFTAEYRAARAEKKRLREILGVD